MDFTGVKAVRIIEGNVVRILDSAGNVLWGAETAKTYTFTVQVKTSMGTAQKTFEMTVK